MMPLNMENSDVGKGLGESSTDDGGAAVPLMVPVTVLPNGPGVVTVQVPVTSHGGPGIGGGGGGGGGDGGMADATTVVFNSPVDPDTEQGNVPGRL